MPEATLSSKNQIVVPREARRALGVRPGDRLLVTVRDNRVIVLEKPVLHHKALLGSVKRPYPKRYLDIERRSWS